MLKVYLYDRCSTCRDAVRWLTQQGIAFSQEAIRETPPPVAELQFMLKARGGKLRALFNTSGQDYRNLGIKEKLETMDEPAALRLLGTNGMLVKRPFAIDASRGIALNGFKQPEWEVAFGVR